MTRRLALVLALAGLVAGASSALAAPRTAPLVVTGLGGQRAALTVPRGGWDVAYPFFTERRLPGGSDAVGGVLIQRARDAALVGGVLLQNAPGFNRAVPVPLVGFDHVVLPAGRYRLTLLGTGRQSVHLVVRGSARAHQLRARGAARPLTRVVASSAATASVWSDPLGRIASTDYVVTGAGSGGDLQQASEDDLCLEPEAVVQQPCLLGGGFTVTPGEGAAGSWSGYRYGPGSLKPGRYVFSGNAVAVGPSSQTAHAAVIISLPR